MLIRRTFLVGAAAVLTIGATAAAPPPHEQSRIDQLIRFVETQKDMKFVRNGTEYSCDEAGRFLRGKLETMGREVTTAREFIERIASKSSMSGEPYHVKFADGRTMLASQFLGQELKRLEGRPATG
ncbi:MAG TPA: DUF5329 family protein [Burkholderiaceae bacterium]|nr:DUF5329 family protein [Burkholderiaceae bacterium]